MKLDNPTQLRLGMTGAFNGKTYRIMGRAVLGVMDGGVIYGWNEFNLQTDSGKSATLVFEEGANEGIHWRWFEMFDPQTAISAEELPTIQHGYSVVVDGTTYFVTEVNQSRVYHIEGVPPEGEQTGTRADYFNATADGELLVVSWTGNEVEYYRGKNLSASTVGGAFNLRGADLLKFRLGRGGGLFSSANQKMLQLVTIVAGIFILISLTIPTKRLPAVITYPAPTSPLTIGAAGTVQGDDYRVLSHEVVEVDQVGIDIFRNEYYLQDEAGSSALLIYGSKPQAKDWILFTPFSTDNPPTPLQAGNFHFGQILRIDDKDATVTEVFREQAISHEPYLNQSGAIKPDPSYGIVATAEHNVYLIRWDSKTINFYRGRAIETKEIKAAFPGATIN